MQNPITSNNINLQAFNPRSFSPARDFNRSSRCFRLLSPRLLHLGRRCPCSRRRLSQRSGPLSVGSEFGQRDRLVAAIGSLGLGLRA